MTKTPKPELTAPAGNLEKLKYAVAHGADAVYFGTEFGSLRSFAGNFTIEQAGQGIDYLHRHGKKGYITLNIYPFSEEYPQLIHTAKTLDSLGADAFIVSDIGVLSQLKELQLRAAIHISTQANTTSYQAAAAYAQMGAKRVNLARELSLEQIRHIRQQAAGRIETEVFIHGAVCFSYSGRCAMSDYLTGFSANRGQCKHPCRWKYFLLEENRPGEYMPVFEDKRGTYLFNSRELALFEYVPALAEAGVSSLKIEGRMKSIHYVASVVSFYRQVIDGVQFSKEQAYELLSRVSNRGYSSGFIKGTIGKEDYAWDGSNLSREAVFVGNIPGRRHNGKTVMEVRNKVCAGEQLELLWPSGRVSTIRLAEPMLTTEGRQVDFANNSMFILLDQDLPEYTILRRVKTGR